MADREAPPAGIGLHEHRQRTTLPVIGESRYVEQVGFACSPGGLSTIMVAVLLSVVLGNLALPVPS